MFCLNHRSIKVTLFSKIHIKIISKISLTYHQIAFYKTIGVVLQSKYRHLPNLRHNSQFLYIQQCTTQMLSMLCLPVYVSNSIPSAYLPYFFPLQIHILSPFTHLSPLQIRLTEHLIVAAHAYRHRINPAAVSFYNLDTQRMGFPGH